MRRIFVMLAGLAAAALIVAAGYQAFNNPMAKRKARLDASLKDPHVHAADKDLSHPANYRKLTEAIDARPKLWQVLIPIPKQVYRGPVVDPLAGVKQLPGLIGNVKALIATKDDPQGRWYSKGDTLKPGVVVEGIKDGVVLVRVTQGGKTRTRSLANK